MYLLGAFLGANMNILLYLQSLNNIYYSVINRHLILFYEIVYIVLFVVLFMEYFNAFGLLLTLVWLYIEILRLVQMILAMFGNDD